MKNGAIVLVDGQYGSTGKGLYADYLARFHHDKVDIVVSNAGPNSGHTFYGPKGKVVLKQLPTYAVSRRLNFGDDVSAYLSAGAIIDPEVLNREVEQYGVTTFLHPNAAVISDADREAEHSGTVAAVAGTRSGTGAAIARKVLRDPDAIVMNAGVKWHHLIDFSDSVPNWRELNAFVEVSQGFSLGLNDDFYPHVTSRECTVAQACADARIPPQLVRQVHMVIRTYPIRVGNVDGFSSGPCYFDQKEMQWSDIPVPPKEPERTTVTNRVRRVFDFSHRQLHDALQANMPDTLLVNFMNYLKPEQRAPLLAAIRATCYDAVGYVPHIRTGYGPNAVDINSEWTKWQPNL